MLEGGVSPDSSPMLPAMVLDTQKEGGEYRALRLSRQTSEARAALIGAYQAPGQYVLACPEGGRWPPAAFALARRPGSERAAIDILVKRTGPTAEALAALPVGATFLMSEPLGRGYDLERARGRDVLALAAGAGIAPIRAALGTLCQSRQDYGRIHLFYGQSRFRDFAYRDWLATLGGAGVSVEMVTSREGEGGYVQQRADTDEQFSDPSRMAVLVCGMRALIDDTRALCERRGLAPEQVLTND